MNYAEIAQKCNKLISAIDRELQAIEPSKRSDALFEAFHTRSWDTIRLMMLHDLTAGLNKLTRERKKNAIR